MDRFAAITGRHYHLFDYAGAPDAERVIVLMGSGAETVQATVDSLNTEARKSGLSESICSVPSRSSTLSQALPSNVQGDCCAGPHERAREYGRAALSGRCGSPQ